MAIVNKTRTHYRCSKDEWYRAGGTSIVGAYRRQLSNGRWLYYLTFGR